MPRCVVKFKDGGYCNLEADSLVTIGEYVQAWNGEDRLVGIFLISEICVAYLSEKTPCKAGRQNE